MKDSDIRHLMNSQVLKEYHDDPDSLVVDELGLCQGSTRVDIAVINGAIHGYEIKSDQDTLVRLPSQVELYSQVLDYATLVVGSPHISHAQSIIPPWWGILLVTQDKAGNSVLKNKRKGHRNPTPNPKAVVQLLWRIEAEQILEEFNLAKGLKGKPRKILWEAIVQTFPYNILSSLVRQALKKRDSWRKKKSSPSIPLPPESKLIARF